VSREQAEGRSVIRVRVLAVEFVTPDDIHAIDLRAAAVDAVRLIELALRVERYDDSRLLGPSDLSALWTLTDTAISLLDAAHAVEGVRR
jgi:hypothetical protein